MALGDKSFYSHWTFIRLLLVSVLFGILESNFLCLIYLQNHTINILSWKGSIGNTDSNFLHRTGLLKIQNIFLRSFSECFLNSSRLVAPLLPLVRNLQIVMRLPFNLLLSRVNKTSDFKCFSYILPLQSLIALCLSYIMASKTTHRCECSSAQWDNPFS